MSFNILTRVPYSKSYKFWNQSTDKNSMRAASMQIGINLPVILCRSALGTSHVPKANQTKALFWIVIELLSLRLQSPPYDRPQAHAPQSIEGPCYGYHPKMGDSRFCSCLLRTDKHPVPDTLLSLRMYPFLTSRPSPAANHPGTAACQVRFGANDRK